MCEKPIILVELLLEFTIVVIQDSEDGKRTVCKKYARKIVNCYRMFAELQEALAGVKALDKAKDLCTSQFQNHPSRRPGSPLAFDSRQAPYSGEFDPN